MSTKRLLGVFAHPDDEGLIGGALLHYKQLGVETGIVYGTRGEVGEIFDPVLATPENLGQVRETEARAAAAILGIDHIWFLEYRDSGLDSMPENRDPRALIRASTAEAVGRLVGIIRQFRPHVMITFNETGANGHPDHIATYQYATSSFHAAADGFLYPELGPAYPVSKLYYTSMARRQFILMAEWLQGQDLEDFFKGLDPHTLGIPDDQISVLLDVERWQDAKAQALAVHRTQVNPNSALAQMPQELQRKWRRTESYQLAASRVGPDIVGENDLFARVLV